MTLIFFQINFDDRKISWPYKRPSMSLDGTDKDKEENIVVEKEDFSHKINSSAWRYEIGMALGVSRIVWWNGGVPAGSNPDLRLARSAFTSKLPRDEMAAADGGYQDGDVHFFTPFAKNTKVAFEKKWNRKLNLIVMTRPCRR